MKRDTLAEIWCYGLGSLCQTNGIESMRRTRPGKSRFGRASHTNLHMTRETTATNVGRDTIRSASKLLLAAVSLLFVGYLFTLLPGVGRLIPRTPLSVAVLVGAIATTVVATLLVVAAPKLALVTRRSFTGPRAVVENFASIVYWFVVLAAVLVAHRGMAGALTPFFGDAVWIYDVGFLLMGLPAVVVIAARLYVSLDPLADLLADRAVGPDGD